MDAHANKSVVRAKISYFWSIANIALFLTLLHHQGGVGGIVELSSPGSNMQIVNCAFKGSESDAAIAFVLSGSPKEGATYYSSLAVKGTVFESNVFQYAAISALRFGQGVAQPVGQTLKLAIEDCDLTDNVVLSTVDGGASFLTRAALFTVFFTDMVITNTRFSGNAIEAGFAPIVAIQSNVVAPNLNIGQTAIYTDTSPECRDVQTFSLTSEINPVCGCPVNRVFTSTGCQEFGPAPIIMQPPLDADCWGSTFDILQSELVSCHFVGLVRPEATQFTTNNLFLSRY